VSLLTRIVLIAIYPLLVLAGLGNRLMGFDRLRLRKSGQASYWVERSQPDLASYFSEASQCEGNGGASLAKPVARFLELIARLYRRRRQTGGPNYKPSVERERGIPDEVYTLW
jgi:hypothetical protein